MTTIGLVGLRGPSVIFFPLPGRAGMCSCSSLCESSIDCGAQTILVLSSVVSMSRCKNPGL